MHLSQVHELDVVNKAFGLDLARINPRCAKSHLMQANRGPARDYEGSARCDKCRCPGLEYHDLFYHCQECRYDTCRPCALIDAQVLNTSDNFFVHECEMRRQLRPRGTSWACGGTDFHGGCASGFSGSSEAEHIPSWRCQRCSFDLCLKCCLKYKNADLTALENVERAQYFILQKPAFG